MFYVGGAAGMRNMGAYNPATTYFPNDLVQHGGTTYIATATATGVAPPAAPWQVLAQGASNSYATDAKWSTD